MVVLIATAVEGSSTVDGHPMPNKMLSQTVRYQGVPIDIHIPLHAETRVHLNESVEIGIPITLTSKLNVTSVHGVVYLTALQSFRSERLALKGNQSGRFILLDVTATPDFEHVQEIYIRTDDSVIETDTPPPLSIAQLMRYVAQTTLAPHQPKPPSSQIKRSVLEVDDDSIYRDFAVTSTLLAAWRSNRWMALAVELRNQSEESIPLSPDAIAGVWRAVGFQHTRLLPKGKRGSQSVVFLVGRHDAITAFRQ